jgi:hypothetical protein
MKALTNRGLTMARLGWTALLAMIVLVTPVAVAAPNEHEHPDHGHAATGAALVMQMQLNDGQRWPTDASLRAGMLEIRSVFDAHHPRIHAGTQSEAQYNELAASVAKAVNRIVEQCKLPAAADAQLHYVVGDLLRGVALMRGSDPAHSRHDGAALVHGALNAYGKFFDDPSWTVPGAKPIA